MKIYQVGGVGLDSNIYLIVDKTVALIDAGTGMNFETVKREIVKLGMKPEDVELLVNTHCHFDHAGGDGDFVRASGCGVAVHRLEARPLRDGDGITTLARTIFNATLEPVRVTRELRHRDRIELGELKLYVLHTPGHTSGSICLYEPKRRLLFSGDTIFSSGIGRVDLPTGDARALHLSIKRLTKLDVQSMYPGHGPVLEGNARYRIFEVAKMMFPGDMV